MGRSGADADRELILLASFRRQPLTLLRCGLFAVHCVILGVGARDTSAAVPLGFWRREWFGFERNHCERIGHLAQGFVPAILGREALLQARPPRRGSWLLDLVLGVYLSFGAFCEWVEWAGGRGRRPGC